MKALTVYLGNTGIILPFPNITEYYKHSELFRIQTVSSCYLRYSGTHGTFPTFREYKDYVLLTLISPKSGISVQFPNIHEFKRLFTEILPISPYYRKYNTITAIIGTNTRKSREYTGIWVYITVILQISADILQILVKPCRYKWIQGIYHNYRNNSQYQCIIVNTGNIRVFTCYYDIFQGILQNIEEYRLYWLYYRLLREYRVYMFLFNWIYTNISHITRITTICRLINVFCGENSIISYNGGSLLFLKPLKALWPKA